MDNPEKLATLDSRQMTKTNKTKKHNTENKRDEVKCWTSLCTNIHKKYNENLIVANSFIVVSHL
jgi:hypothetical protein